MPFQPPLVRGRRFISADDEKRPADMWDVTGEPTSSLPGKLVCQTDLRPTAGHGKIPRRGQEESGEWWRIKLSRLFPPTSNAHLGS